MAVSVPVLLTSGSINDSLAGSDTTAAFTPTSRGLIVVSVATNDAGGETHTVDGISDTFGGLVWTKISEPVAADRRHCTVFYARAPNVPSSGTVTFTYSADVVTVAWVVSEVVGQKVVSPASENNSDNGSGASLTINLLDFDIGNQVIGSIADMGNQNIAPGAGWTEIAEVSTTSSGSRCQQQYAGLTSCVWNNLDNRYQAGVVVEFKKQFRVKPIPSEFRTKPLPNGFRTKPVPA